MVSLLIFQASIAGAQQAAAGRDTVLMSAFLPVNYILDASSSTSDNQIINFYWVYNGDTIGNSEILDVTLSEKKNTFTLIIEDNQSNTDADVVDIYVGHPTNYGNNRLPLRGGTLNKFVSGMNIAWKDYANDLNEFSLADERYFQEVFDSIRTNGGNSLRWWLHTNGANSPIINDMGFVEGIDFESIQAMKRVLDMAYDNGIVISMCLWSFDMLQNQNQDLDAMKLLLTDATNIQSYVDNALIPILDLIGDHPAVMTWEIFNEPEGMTSSFGWTPTKVQMTDVQRFVNMCAGAIHRNTTQALVSNGAWNIQVSTDVDGFKNYYSQENLMTVGGDPDGYLDFYQIHYYPNHFGAETSPFHRPASHWELDAPIVIGEFPADTIAGRANPGFSVERAYELAVHYGYAGVMSWSWSDENFNRDYNTTAAGLRKVQSIIGQDLDIPTDLDLDRIPLVVKNITPFRALIEDVPAGLTFTDLKNHFNDEEDGANLSFSIKGTSNDIGVTPQIENNSEVKLIFSEPISGLTEIDFRAADGAGWYAETGSLVMLGTLQGNESNNAYFKPISSGTEAFEKYNLYANDGDLYSSWESELQDYDTLVIDLKSSYNQNFIALHWDHLAVSTYQFQVSEDSISWETLFSEQYDNNYIITYAATQQFSAQYMRLIMEKNGADRPFRVFEIISEQIIDNEAPTVIKEIDDLTVFLPNPTNMNNYVRFDQIFEDLEHKEYLTYTFETSDADVVQAERSIGNVGVNLIFNQYVPGFSTVTITATDPFGLSASTSFSIEVNDPVLGLNKELNPITIYPNPVSDRLFISSEEGTANIGEIIIYDMAGKIIEQFDAGYSPKAIDVSQYEPGSYLLLLNIDGVTKTKRFIKK